MKLSHLFENPQVMDLLGEVADWIIDLLPATIRDGETAKVSLGSYSRERELEKLLDRYGGDQRFRAGLRELSSLEIYVDNEHTSSIKGSYTHMSHRRDAVIVVYCKTGSNEDEWGKPLYTTARKAHEGISTTLKSTLVHELRHHFQRYSYSNYYGKNIGTGDYHKNPIEIDAAWFHHLEEFDATEYSSAKSFANALMKSFTEYKRMDPTGKWAQHYYRKTIKYWLARMGKPNETQTLHDRLVAAREQRSEILASMIPTETIDLRGIEGYSADSFFIQSDMLRSARAMITKYREISPGNCYLIALMMLFGHAADRPSIKKYLPKLAGVSSFSDILDANPFPEKFDRATIDRFMREQY